MTGIIVTSVLVSVVIQVVSVFGFLCVNFVMQSVVLVLFLVQFFGPIMTLTFMFTILTAMPAVLLGADFEVFMRKLSSLCLKLRRLGYDVCVVSHFRGNYRVYLGSVVSPFSYSDYRDFLSVRECEQYLLGLFR